jgi:hypothetical protein
MAVTGLYRPAKITERALAYPCPVCCPNFFVAPILMSRPCVLWISGAPASVADIVEAVAMCPLLVDALLLSPQPAAVF